MGSLTKHFEALGIEQKTTFDMDFDIAERFGTPAIKDTFNRAFREWKSDVEYLTELALVMNWKCWWWYGKNNAFAELYDSYWKKADKWAMDNLKGEELSYYLSITD